jgi:hypothetical protein
MHHVKNPVRHKNDLRAALEAAGWDVEVVEHDTFAWWMHELWRITSRWRPSGVSGFVAFVGSPWPDGLASPGADHVAIGPQPPENWQGGEVTRFELRPWPEQIQGIIAECAKLRDAA